MGTAERIEAIVSTRVDPPSGIYAARKLDEKGMERKKEEWRARKTAQCEDRIKAIKLEKRCRSLRRYGSKREENRDVIDRLRHIIPNER